MTDTGYVPTAVRPPDRPPSCPCSMIAPAALLAIALPAAAAIAVPSARAAPQGVEAIIAVDLRQKGYVCDKPERAERDPTETTPLQTAWVITCETGRYQVIFGRNRLSRVRRIDEPDLGP